MASPLFPKGRFDEVSVLDESGGMGVIYRCRKGSRITVVKRLRDPLPDPTFLDRFKREIRINQTLDHPNIVKTLEVRDSAAPYWYEMEFAESGSLKRHIPAISKSVEDIHSVFTQICEGVRYLHEHQRKVIHRDLKPQNILVFSDGTIKVADVGLARYVDRDTTTLTQTGLGWGTPFYLSPEQIADFKNVGPSTDIFALGIILFELFTDTPMLGLHDIDSEIPAPYGAVIKRLIRRDPKDRFQSVSELLDELKSRVRLHEEVSAYEDPQKKAAEIIEAANQNQSIDTEEVERLLQIFRENVGVENFVWKAVEIADRSLLDIIAENESDAFHEIVRLYIQSCNQAMAGRFPFGWMDDWTDFLLGAFRATLQTKTRVVALRQVFVLAYSANQFYTQRKVAELVASLQDTDVSAVIEALESEEQRQQVAEALEKVAMHPKLRRFLYGAS